MDNLNPCSCCGADPQLLKDYSGTSTTQMVRCPNPECDQWTVVGSDSREKAREAWNKLHPDYPVIECPMCDEECDRGKSADGYFWAGCKECGLYASDYEWENIRDQIQQIARFFHDHSNDTKQPKHNDA